MKKSKKITLPLLLTLGGVTIPIIAGSTIISNSNANSDRNISLISDRGTVNTKKEFGKDEVEALIKEKTDAAAAASTTWDGVLVAADFPDVTSIAADAFRSKRTITSITLPDTVTSIGATAFINTSGITGDDASSKINLTYSTNIKTPNANFWGTTAGRLSITGENVIDRPTIAANGIITPEFVNDLIAYKNYQATGNVAWNGVLVEADFNTASSVADDAFNGKTEITSIILPNTVKTIGADAFNGAAGLTTITALGAISIGNGAFTGANAIETDGIKLTYSTDIKLPNATLWGTTADKLSIDNTPIEPTVPSNVITPTFVEELIIYKNSLIPSGDTWDGVLVEADFNTATSVADDAFNGKTEITSITLPDTVTSIGVDAFNGAAGLKTITALGATSIGNGAFTGANAIETDGIKLTYSTDIKSPNATLWGTTADKLSIDNTPIEPTVPSNVITPTFVEELIIYKNSLIPSGDTWDGVLVEADFNTATSVADDAFNGKTEITSIILPNTVKTIGADAFNGAAGLKTITALGATSIGNGAFTGANAIETDGIKLTYSTDIKSPNATLWGTTADKLSIDNTPIEPTVPSNVITPTFVEELIIYKNSLIPSGDTWDGVLVEADFNTATSVADDAFNGKTEITSIILPNTVKTIGADAFNGAAGLTTITALGAISIGNGAFTGANAIETDGIKLTYSTDIKSPNATLWGTTADKLSIDNTPIEPTVPSNVITPTFVEELIIYKNSLIPSGDTWDGVLVEADFNTATSVADDAFNGKTEITSIILPNTVKTIGDDAFDGATGLTTITALGATSIGANAFAGTTGIDGTGVNKINLKYSDNIKTPNANFWGVTNLAKLSIADETIIDEPIIADGIITTQFVTKLIAYKNYQATGNVAWNGVLVEADFENATSVADGAFENKTTITSIILPTGVLDIGANAFSGATSLKTITALGATSIGNGAFTGANAIETGGIRLTESENINSTKAGDWGTSIDKLEFLIKPEIPEDGIVTPNFITKLIQYKELEGSWNGALIENDFVGAKSIGANVFENNTNIILINLPKSVTAIGANAFSGATSLITISALGAESIGANAFARTTSIGAGGIRLTESANIKSNKAEDWGTTTDKLDITSEIIPPTPPNDDSLVGTITAISIVSNLLLISLAVGAFWYYTKKIDKDGKEPSKNSEDSLKDNKRSIY